VLDFEKFMDLTEKIAPEIVKEKAEKLTEKIELRKKAIESEEAKSLASEKIDQIKQEIEQGENAIKSLEKVTKDAAIESLWVYLGLHDPNIVFSY